MFFPMKKEWFSMIGNNKVVWCTEAVYSWVSTKMGGFDSSFLLILMRKIVFALFTCSLALGGATVGTIFGAIQGQTTETGFLRGAVIGAVAGAITAVQLMESTAHGEPFSKVALFVSLINGKVFREWVTPAVLKAYQWQISGLEAAFSENSDIFETNGSRGLSEDSISKLPKHKFFPSRTLKPGHGTSCIICLEDFKEGELTRELRSCGHTFHLQCIDEWLTRHGSCPVCRKDV